MAQPTLQDIFGANATQTSTTITLTKADFADVGLTAQSTNTGEQIFAAIVELAKLKLNDAARTADADISITIEEGLDSLQTSGTTRFRVKNRSVDFYSLDETSTLNPMDY